MPAMVGGGMVFQIALAVDRWVHKQGYDGVKLAEEIDTVRKDMHALRVELATVTRDITRLNALDEAAHRHVRQGD